MQNTIPANEAKNKLTSSRCLLILTWGPRELTLLPTRQPRNTLPSQFISRPAAGRQQTKSKEFKVDFCLYQRKNGRPKNNHLHNSVALCVLYTLRGGRQQDDGVSARSKNVNNTTLMSKASKTQILQTDITSRALPSVEQLGSALNRWHQFLV